MLVSYDVDVVDGYSVDDGVAFDDEVKVAGCAFDRNDAEINGIL